MAEEEEQIAGDDEFGEVIGNFIMQSPPNEEEEIFDCLINSLINLFTCDPYSYSLTKDCRR